MFPHAIRGNPPAVAFYTDLRRTPFADELTLDVALEAMKAHRIGEDAVTDILAVGFSATDVIGHTYGPDSHEVMDQLLRLDLVLQRLFAEIDRRAGLANTLVVLTSDHGVDPLVENLRAKGVEARRAPSATLENAVKEAFDKRFPGADALIRYYLAPDFYLNEDVMRDRNLSRKNVEDAAVAALLATGLVAKVYTHDDLRNTRSSPDPFFRLFQNGFYEPRSPQLTVLLKPHVYLNDLGWGHGPWHGRTTDDRHVPIVFMGPANTNLVPTVRPCGPEDIAPTLARILGLPLQREQDSRLLTEMLTGNQ